MLFQNRINFNELPAWQQRGTGLYWEKYEKEGYNPIQDKAVLTTRRIKIEKELPMKDAYGEFIRHIFATHEAAKEA